MTHYQRIRIKLIRLFNYEYWPMLVFYFPMFFYGFYLAFRSRSLTYFTTANPSMKYGGIMGESKKKILGLISPVFLPKSIFMKYPADIDAVFGRLREESFHFPMVAKPNIGERGVAVEKIENSDQLSHYLSKNREDIILQEFIDYPVEVGILYHRYPNEPKGNISSIVVKGFLEIEGNGKDSFLQLMEKKTRAFARLAYLKNKYSDQLERVLAKREKIMLEPIGNHSRGTTFLNGNYLINEQLRAVIDRISKDIKGFYYGRFDMKVKSLEDLYDGENIRILELNGVSSEPAHIYDPSFRLIKAYGEIMKHMKIIYKISQMNYRAGVKRDSFLIFLKDIKKHFRLQKYRKQNSI